MSRSRLHTHESVGFAMLDPPLRMADNDGARPRIGEHLGGDFAGMRAGGLGCAVLGPEGDGASK